MITTSLKTNEGTIIHEGTSGLTVTATREGMGVETLIEHSPLKKDELREMICVLLCMLEEKAGEKFIASCFARYAEETGKRFLSEGNGRKIVMIRG